MKMPAMNLRRTYLIARRDYLGYVKTWGFWISFCLPFVIGGIIIAVNLAGVSVSPTRYETILDETGQHASAILQSEQDKQKQLMADILNGMGETLLSEADAETLANTIESQDIEAGKAYLETKVPGTTKRMKALDSKMIFIDPPANDLNALKAYMRGEKMAQYNGKDVKLNGVLHIYNDGTLTANYWSPNVTDNPVRSLARNYFRDVSIDNYLTTGGLDREGYDTARDNRIKIEAFDPTKKETADGKGQEVTSKDRIPYIVAFVLSMFLWMTVFSGAYMLLTSMLEEKMNKLLEMMLATTRFSEIILGKLLGVALLTLTALLPYIIMGIVGVIGAIIFGPSDLAQGLITAFSAKMIIFFTIFLVLGYIFYGSLFISLGALAESMQDANTLSTPIMFVLMGAVFIVPIGLTSPDSPLLIFASWFPLSSPFAMIMRLPSDPPLWQLLTSVGLLAAVTFGVILLSGRIFRYGVLSGAGVKGATDWFKRTILRRKTG
ncbi:ABC transporter permease [Hellea sp.]|nr:ABC transporter permease [Hellea sp.]